VHHYVWSEEPSPVLYVNMEQASLKPDQNKIRDFVLVGSKAAGCPTREFRPDSRRVPDAFRIDELKSEIAGKLPMFSVRSLQPELSP
jgi:hypothetical protein